MLKLIIEIIFDYTNESKKAEHRRYSSARDHVGIDGLLKVDRIW